MEGAVKSKNRQEKTLVTVYSQTVYVYHIMWHDIKKKMNREKKLQHGKKIRYADSTTENATHFNIYPDQNTFLLKKHATLHSTVQLPELLLWLTSSNT